MPFVFEGSIHFDVTNSSSKCLGPSSIVEVNDVFFLNFQPMGLLVVNSLGASLGSFRPDDEPWGLEMAPVTPVLQQEIHPAVAHIFRGPKII